MNGSIWTRFKTAAADPEIATDDWTIPSVKTTFVSLSESNPKLNHKLVTATFVMSMEDEAKRLLGSPLKYLKKVVRFVPS